MLTQQLKSFDKFVAHAPRLGWIEPHAFPYINCNAGIEPRKSSKKMPHPIIPQEPQSLVNMPADKW